MMGSEEVSVSSPGTGDTENRCDEAPDVLPCPVWVP